MKPGTQLSLQRHLPQHSMLRRFEEAITCYQQDIAICPETGDRIGGGQTLSNLGIAYRGLRRFEEAIGCYQESLAIRRETGDRYGEGQTLNNLGTAYQGLRRFEEGHHLPSAVAGDLRGDR